MSSSAITTQVAQLKIGSVQNQADSSSVYSAGVWSFKNSTALTSVTITDAGNVGIGTASPLFQLHTLTSATGTTVASNVVARFASNGSGRDVAVQFSDSVANSAALGMLSGNMYFITQGTERMRISASGNLQLGDTINPGNNKLRVYAGTQNGFQVDCSGNTTTTGVEIDVGANNTTQLALLVYSISNAAVNALIYSNGTFASRTSTYGGISDIKLKENVIDATPKLEDLCKVRVVNYNLIGEQEKHLGVIAQELEQVFPGMVFESPDRDAEGKETGEVTKSVKYSIFIPMLVKAIQEQQAQIEALKTEVAALKAP